MATKRKAEKSGKARGLKESGLLPLSPAEIVEGLFQLPEIAEAFTRADLELALDDRGWLTTNSSTARELDPQTRRVLISKSRMYHSRDPLAKSAVRLWTVYAFGDGMTWTAKDDAVSKELKACFGHPKNRPVFTAEGQMKSSRKVLVDGDVYFAAFGKEGETKIFRRIDPLQMIAIITDPDDDEHILGYARQMADGKTVKFYKDWAADEEDVALGERQRIENKAVSFEDDVVVYKASFDAFGMYGNGLLFAAIDWTREHRRFMEARVALTQALSKYAHKLTLKGGQAVIDQAKQRLQSTYQANGPSQVERNPSSAPGGTWLQNAGATLEQFPRATGAGDGEKDSNQLKLMVCAATGIMLHYFGDPSTGNLATATAMELPMLKMFLGYQKFWKDIYRDLMSIALEEDPAEEAAEIDIDFPPILKDDLTSLAAAINSLVTAFPEMAVDEVIRMCLISLGLDDVDEVMKQIESKRSELEAKAAEQAAAFKAGPAKTGKPGSANPDAIVPEANNMSTEAAKLLSESLDRVALAIGAA